MWIKVILDLNEILFYLLLEYQYYTLFTKIYFFLWAYKEKNNLLKFQEFYSCHKRDFTLDCIFVFFITRNHFFTGRIIQHNNDNCSKETSFHPYGYHICYRVGIVFGFWQIPCHRKQLESHFKILLPATSDAE